MKKALWSAAALIICLVCVLGILPKRKKKEPVSRSTVAMGAIVQQTVYGDEKTAQNAITDASAAITKLENRISWRIDSSEAAALNRGERITPSEEVADLLKLCAAVREQSGGAFDALLLPVTRLWDFEAEIFTPPTEQTVREALSHCGASLDLSGETLQLRGGGLDLGGIGKGAGCDAAVKIYRAAGIEAAVVSVGGSIGTYGAKPDGSAWKVAVRDPNADSGILGTLALTEGFVSTSGTYEKQRTYENRVYHHLLDPKTGMPAETDLVSATVIADSGALSDALATAAIVMGKDAAETFLQTQDVAYLLVTADRTLCANEAFRAVFTQTATDYQWEAKP